MFQPNPVKATGVVPPEIATRDSGLAFLKAMMAGAHPGPPISTANDFWLAEAEDGRVVFEGNPSERFFNPLGTIHGGWIATLLDSAMGCAVHSTLKPGFGYTTIDMSISYVRAVMPTLGTLRCEGRTIHVGGRIATSEGRLVDATGKLLAHGTETCMIFPVGKTASAA
jgi:uncharacterized protein (TIGR00369 family)